MEKIRGRYRNISRFRVRKLLLESLDLVQRKFKVDAETYEKEIEFQIMLKGFTDVGTPLGDLLAESIKGYTIQIKNTKKK